MPSSPGTAGRGEAARQSSAVGQVGSQVRLTAKAPPISRRMVHETAIPDSSEGHVQALLGVPTDGRKISCLKLLKDLAGMDVVGRGLFENIDDGAPDGANLRERLPARHSLGLRTPGGVYGRAQ